MVFRASFTLSGPPTIRDALAQAAIPATAAAVKPTMKRRLVNIELHPWKVKKFRSVKISS